MHAVASSSPRVSSESRARRPGDARRLHSRGVPSSRSSSRASPRSATRARANAVDVDAGKFMLEREEYLFVDCRSWKEYDRSHITKPPQRTINVPLAEDASADSWVKAAREKTRPAMKLLIVDVDGSRAEELVDALVEAGYTNAVAVEGGYSTWMSKYTPFGRKVPPKGKFVSTGREALKSGLDLDPTVASAYEENWGRQDYKP